MKRMFSFCLDESAFAKRLGSVPFLSVTERISLPLRRVRVCGTDASVWAAFGVLRSDAPNLLRKSPPLDGDGFSDALSSPLLFLVLRLFILAICTMDAAMGMSLDALARLCFCTIFVFL